MKPEIGTITESMPRTAKGSYAGPGAPEIAASGVPNRAYAAGTGSAVTDLIFSIAKREVTFFSGTVPISFL
jgi:hypothetical protein